MFPIKDLVGKTIGFGGRIIQNTKQTAKYINTPETKLYSKGRNIYGLYEAKNTIVEKDEVFIVEGYTDVMALHQHEVKNAVASLGTALTTEQIELLSRFTKNIILVFDSDTAGVNASLKGIERLREYNVKLDLYYESNINIKVAVLEEGYDPADFVMKKGKEKFQEKANAAVGIIDFTIEMILKKYNLSNLNEKLNAADELLKLISTLSSKIVQEECIKKISQKLDLREDLLIEQMLKKSYLNLSGSRNFDEGGKESEAISPLKNIEIEALKILINGTGNKFDELLNIGSEYFKFDDTKKLYELIAREIEEKKKEEFKINFPLEISSNKLENDDLRKLYNFLMFIPVNYTNPDLMGSEIYNNLKRIHISDQIDYIRKQMLKLENYMKEIRKLKENNASSIDDVKIKEEKIENKIRELSLKLNDLESEKRKYIFQN